MLHASSSQAPHPLSLSWHVLPHQHAMSWPDLVLCWDSRVTAPFCRAHVHLLQHPVLS